MQQKELKDELFSAIYDGDIVKAAILIPKITNINARRNKDLRTPLFQAVLYRRMDILELLIDHGALAHTVERELCTPLYLAMVNRHMESFRLLLAHGAYLFYGNEKYGAVGTRLLRYRGDYDFLKAVIESGEDLSLYDFTDLHAAVVLGDISAVSKMLESGADGHFLTKYGISAFEYARLCGTPEMFEVFEKYGYV